MRLSVRMDDPGFDVDMANDKLLHIFIDGRDICGVCHTADEDRGEAHVFKLDDRGEKYIDPENSEQAAQEVLFGKIQIIRTETVSHNDLARTDAQRGSQAGAQGAI